MLIFIHFTKAEGVKAGFAKLPAKFPCAQFRPESSQYLLETQLHIHSLPERIQPIP